MTPTTQIPLRASADIEPNRVISRSGAYTAAKTANETTEPIGVSADWTVQPPIVDYGLSTLHARGAQADPVSFYGRGEKCYVRVGTTAISAGGGRVKVMADGSGRVIPTSSVPPRRGPWATPATPRPRWAPWSSCSSIRSSTR
jgi:hypothetical protein